MRSESNQTIHSHSGLHYFADTPNILHLRYVLARYPDVDMSLIYNEIMANFNKLVGDASEFAYFMTNFPSYTASISLLLTNHATFVRIISCNSANLLLIARLYPSMAMEWLFHFRDRFPSIPVSKEIVDEIDQLDSQAQLRRCHRFRMFHLPLSLSSLASSKSGSTNTNHKSARQYKFPS